MTTLNSSNALVSLRIAKPNWLLTFVKKSYSFGSVRSISKASGIGLKSSSSSFRVSAMTIHTVKLIGPNGKENDFVTPDDVYINDSAENAGLEPPYSCKAGACSTCTGKLVSGSVDQSAGMILNEKHIEKGYVLTCVPYPTSDCVILTHKQDDLY